ncbi:hypothetical protein TBLA_0B00840 [Henningerozyma blattae CBS 6284]|uniref:Major facilitator superfamily (MFS) profile domain-containing protein n=1 Tax=Henningerozyma blattae (strain ATCC 34711 / CBS 6284 / DSM 70876 / NBRC 10599 / NRRL Y-10934 / UCD 77-7) TaxID=1071380 RepID=I2GXS5_HENB6|nr:hypothetical protein TBLA_0B00840 [Tetrapisispora blattae CBS 6284]CCH58927.1 hypothetical protein TBLA_0B00840 [Tetrapisispora blattae CBS 6284]
MSDIEQERASTAVDVSRKSDNKISNDSVSLLSTPSNKELEEEKGDLQRPSEDETPASVSPLVPSGINWGICILCLMVAFGGYISGWDSGTIGGFEAHTDFLARFGSTSGEGKRYLSKVRTGLLTSMFNVGQAIGSFFLGRLGDIYGRRIGLIVASVIFIIGTVIQIASVKAWYQYMIGRIIAGLGCGLIAILSPMLISEVSPKNMRGAMVSCYQLMITLGIFLGYCTNYGTKKYHNSRQWRIPLGLQFAWCLFMIGAMLFVPESPRFLIEKGRIEEAKRSIAKSNAVSAEDPVTIYELDEIQAAVEKERFVGTASWKDLLDTQHKILQRVVMGIMILALQQLTGCNYFFYYGTTIFKAVGLEDGFETAIVFGVVNFFSTFCALFLVDRFGRRTCLLWGAAGMTCCMVVFASVGVTRLWPHGKKAGIVSKGAGNCMIVFSCFFIFCFATSWAPIAFVIISESFPLRVKAKGMALATVSNQMWNFCIGFFTPFISGSINFAYGYVFMGCLVFAWFYVFFFVPETKGLVLEEVDVMWQEGVLPWKSAEWVPPSQRNADYDADVLANDDQPVWKRIFGKTNIDKNMVNKKANEKTEAEINDEIEAEINDKTESEINTEKESIVPSVPESTRESVLESNPKA